MRKDEAAAAAAARQSPPHLQQQCGKRDILFPPTPNPLPVMSNCIRVAHTLMSKEREHCRTADRRW